MKAVCYNTAALWAFPGGPVVESPASNAGGTALMLEEELQSRVPAGRLGPGATTREPRTLPLLRLRSRLEPSPPWRSRAGSTQIILPPVTPGQGEGGNGKQNAVF